MKIDTQKARTYLTWGAVALGAGLVFLAPFPGGCQEQRHWSVMAAFCVLLGAIALGVRALDDGARSSAARAGSSESPRRSRRVDPVLVALGALAAVLLLQLVPLPAALVGIMSPARLRLAREVAGATGDPVPAWLTLTTCLKCTRDSLLLLVGYISVFYAASTLFAAGKHRGPATGIVMGAAVASASVLAFRGFAQVLASRGTRLSSTFVNPNRFAALMACAGACAVGMFLAARDDRRDHRATGEFRFPPGTIWLAAAVVIETALVLTLSRLGIASALVAGLLTIALCTGRRSVWVALTGVLLVLAANAALAIDPVLGRYSVLFEENLAGLGRPRCWRTALPLVREFPVLGSGAGTFEHVFRLHQDPSLPGWWRFAHNDYLNLLTDTGVLGFATGVAAIMFAMRRIARLRLAPDAVHAELHGRLHGDLHDGLPGKLCDKLYGKLDQRGVAVAAFLGLSAVLVHSAADFPLRQPAVAVLFFALAGTAYGRAADGAETGAQGERKRGEEQTGNRPEPGPRWILPAYLAAAAVLCAATLPVLVRLRIAGRLKAEASGIPVGREEEVESADLLRRVEVLERAAVLDPWDAAARYEAARTRVRLIAEGACTGEAQSVIRSAERELREGRATSPLDPRPYYLGAILAWRPDAMEHPDRMMLLALRMAPAWHDVSYQVGRYFLKRWRHANRAAGTFGLLRWQRSVGRVSRETHEPDELFGHMASSLTFAARSPDARRAAAELVLDHGLSAREIDAALSPDAETELALAGGLARRGDHVRASTRYRRALASGDLRPPLHRIRTEYARSLLRTGKREAALEQFDAALAESPPEELAATVRALASLRPAPADLTRLVDYWAAVRERMPTEPAALCALARAELALGRDEAGFEHLLSYARETKDPGALAELARFALARNELKLARAFAAEAARLDPDRLTHHMTLGETLVRLGEDDAAAASFGKALLLQPRNLRAARALSRIEEKAGRFPRAIEIWERFIAAGGAAAPAHEALADIYLKLLHRDRAAEHLEKALRANPRDRRLRKKLEALGQ